MVPVTDTRTRLIDAAQRLFHDKGYASTSVADVLKDAGANSGSLYHFFPGKQDLLLAVLERYRQDIHAQLLDPAWQGVDDPIERVFALLARYRLGVVMTDCTFGCPIGNLALELHEPDPPVREALADNFAAWTAAIHECFESAGDRLPPGVDRRALAQFVLTTMEGAVMQARTFRDVAYFDASVGELGRYIACLEQSGARTPSGRRRASRAA